MQTSLFIIDLTYIADLAAIDRLIERHRAFLKENYDAGRFLVSGPKEPRTGGVILARGDSVEAIERLIEKDPFKRKGVADYKVTQFEPAMTTNNDLVREVLTLD